MMIGAFDLPRVRFIGPSSSWPGCRVLNASGSTCAATSHVKLAKGDVAGPDIPITIDANQWLERDPLPALHSSGCAPYNILVAEQPIAPGDPEVMASLRSVGISDQESTRACSMPRDAWNIRAARSADVAGQYLSRQKRR